MIRSSGQTTPGTSFSWAKIRPYVGWTLATVLPLLTFQFTQDLNVWAGNPQNMMQQREFIAFVVLAVVMWMFDLTPAFVTAMLVLLVSVLLEIAPREVILSGFISDTFFLCLGIFILAAQVFSSGLIYRLALNLLRLLPQTRYTENLIVFLSGSLLTLVIPSPLGRSALITPLIFDLIGDDAQPGAGPKKSAILNKIYELIGEGEQTSTPALKAPATTGAAETRSAIESSAPVATRPIAGQQAAESVAVKKNEDQEKLAASGKRAGALASASKKSLNITPLLISALHGTTLLGTIFLTGNPLNLVMLGYFSAQTQYRFQWINWLQASIVVGAIMVLGYLGIIIWQVRKSEVRIHHKDRFDALLKKRGPMTPSEWGALLALLVLIVGVLTIQIHRIELVWLCLGTGLGLYMYGTLTAKDLRTHIDWSTLLFIASIVSWTPIIAYLKIDQLVIKFLGTGLKSLNVDLTQYAGTQAHLLPLVFIVLFVIIMVIRMFFPGGPTFVILMSAFVPLFTVAGISPWVLGFSMLTVSEGFFLPYQHGVYSQMIEELTNRNLLDAYNSRDLLISNIIIMVVKILAICVSLYYWSSIAII